MNLIFKHAGAALGMVFAVSAIAAPILPTYDTFGPLAGVTFGGTGIPNDPVAISNLYMNTAGQALTMGLSATPRFSGVVTNDGMGTYSAAAGVSPNAPSPANPYAVWNFNSYIGGAAASSLFFQLFYDFDPTVGNLESTHGTVRLTGAAAVTLSPNGSSSNLGFDSLETSGTAVVGPFSIITVAPGGTFNPNASGQYTFALVAYTDSLYTNAVARTAIAVNVPEPGTFALAGLALLGLVAARRRA